MKIFNFRFLTDLHVLECPEHDFRIFIKCLSLYDRRSDKHKFCGCAKSKTNGRNCMKFYIELPLNINSSWWLDFGVYRSRSSAVVRNFLFLSEYGVSVLQSMSVLYECSSDGAIIQFVFMGSSIYTVNTLLKAILLSVFSWTKKEQV